MKIPTECSRYGKMAKARVIKNISIMKLEPKMWHPDMTLKEYPMDPKRFIWFSKSKEPFGFLGNMSGGMPLNFEGFSVPDSETLYQLLRFSGSVDVQREILKTRNGFHAKMISKPYRITNTTPNWNLLRFPAMLWCLGIKVFQWPEILESLNTTNHVIVEKSSKDPVWGCLVRDGRLVGVNALGQCWHQILTKSDFTIPPREMWDLTIPLEEELISVKEMVKKISSCFDRINGRKDPVININWPSE